VRKTGGLLEVAVATNGSFKKGFDPRRNPGGRPKNGFSLVEMIRNASKEDYEAVAAKLWAEAKKGNLQAVQIILDRLYGKPEALSKVQLGSDPDAPLRFKIIYEGETPGFAGEGDDAGAEN
jgi:hypothetical protein